METVTLNDGTVLAGHILENGDNRIIFVYLDGLSLVEGVTYFSDPERTSVIHTMNHGTEKVYIGYTDLYSASREYGNGHLVLRKADANVA